MRWNDLKGILRGLRRHAGYTTINVAGLALGLAACLLIALYVRHELSYDDFHDDAEQIYRVVSDYGDTVIPMASWPAIEEIKRRNPSLTVAQFVHSSATVGREPRRFKEDHLFLARPAFFDVFTFPLRRGTAGDTFDRPNTAVLTPAKARKYFGDQDPVGKTMEVKGLLGAPDTTLQVTVTGVLEPIPGPSHFHPQVIVSWATFKQAAPDVAAEWRSDWRGQKYRAYLKVPADTDPSALADAFTKHVQEQAGAERDVTLRLQRMTDIHLYSNLSLELEPNGSAAYVYVFAFVALVILVLAGVNFVNLALARSVERTQEVGVRKSIGATRGQIAWQFVAEALLLAGAAAVLGMGLAAAVLPVFRSVTGIEVTTAALTAPFTAATLAGTALVVALGSAAYPAFVLSRHRPVEVLGGGGKGASGRGGQSGSRLRRGLVVFQFVVAVALGAGTIAAYWQLNYLQEADLGFGAEQVVTLPMPPSVALWSPTNPQEAASVSRAFRREAARQPGVQAVSKASRAVPAESLPRNADFAFRGLGVSEEERHNLRLMVVGPRFFNTMDIDMVAGRGFESGRASDTTAVVINRAAYQQLAKDLSPEERSPDNVVGRSFDGSLPWLPPSMRSEGLMLIGVAENAHLSSLRRSISPTAFLLTPPSLNDTYYLRVDRDNVEQALSGVESVWRDFFPDVAFNYRFADQAFAAAYRAERRTSTLISVFAGLALAIACLGLFGLGAVAVRQRRQEIAVRKAVGASARQIVALFSTDFARLVGVAIIVAVPLAYVGLSQWLDTFAYHVDLGPSVFLIAGGGALLAALLAVSGQAVRAARTDPATVLRNE